MSLRSNASVPVNAKPLYYYGDGTGRGLKLLNFNLIRYLYFKAQWWSLHLRFAS